VLLNIESSPASVKVTRQIHSHIPDEDMTMEVDDDKNSKEADDSTTKLISVSLRIEAVEYLKRQFGEAYSKQDSDDEIIVKVDQAIAEVNIDTLEIKTDDETLRDRLTSILPRVLRFLRPLESCPE
ncbi:13876_t:CDS:2, partial [Acaulospora morrowiae]